MAFNDDNDDAGDDDDDARLFKHQALAIDAAAAGRHVALSTATSSGKSVVFNVSVIEALVGPRPDAVALYLFPTKALAQDQLRSDGGGAGGLLCGGGGRGEGRRCL